jgi:hypothetical protein
LHARHGRALASAGRLAEAAVELHRAAALADGRSRAELERLSVENLLKAGQLDRGLDAAAALLATVGEDLPRRPLLALLVERARLRLRGLGVVERSESEVDHSVLDHIDLLWSLASGLTFVEPILGTALHTRLLREALDAGEPRRAALALAQELAYVAMSGAPAQARLDALHAQGSALAERSGQDGVRGFVELGRGVGTYLAGRFKDGLAGIDAGAARMRKAPQDLSWQLDVGHIFRVAALWWLGDLTELRRFQEDKLHDAFDSGNVNLQRHLSSWPGAVTWIVRGEPDLAQERIDNAFNRPTLGETFNLHHFHALLGLGFADLYAGRPELAHKRTESFWSAIERTHVLRVQISNIEALFLRGCAALAMGKPDLAERCAAKMWRQDVDHARALASSVRGSIAHARGDHQAARTAWTEARDSAEIAGMALHVAVMRWRLGDTEPANAWFVSQGVVDVERLVRMVSP